MPCIASSTHHTLCGVSMHDLHALSCVKHARHGLQAACMAFLLISSNRGAASVSDMAILSAKHRFLGVKLLCLSCTDQLVVFLSKWCHGVFCRMAPLTVCAPSVAHQFLQQAQRLSLMDCSGLQATVSAAHQQVCTCQTLCWTCNSVCRASTRL